MRRDPLRTILRLSPCLFLLALLKFPLLVPYQPSLHYRDVDQKVHYYLKPARLSVEGMVEAQRQELGLGGVRVDLKLRQKIGQNLSIAMLSGFRGIVANFIWIEAHKAWEAQRWYKIKPYFDIVTLLQPQVGFFWDTAAWHMAWNVSYSVRMFCVNQKPPKPEAECVREHEEWIALGRRYLEQSLLYNPDSWELHFKLGWLISEKQADRVADAIPYYQFAASHPDAPRYIARQVGFAQEEAGKYRDAFETWKRLWIELKQNPRRDEMPRVLLEHGRKMEAICLKPGEAPFFGKITDAEMVDITNNLFNKPLPPPHAP